MKRYANLGDIILLGPNYPMNTYLIPNAIW